MVLLEAMQSKMAVIAFDCPTGPRNIIDDQVSGLLIEDNNIEAFSFYLQKLIEDNSYSQFLARNAYYDVQSYGIENIMIKWDRLLSQSISR